MSEPPPPYPPIDPTTFDLIVVGTGLQESLIAAAASASGKSVLHLDHNHFYGSHFASLSISDLNSFLNSNSNPNPPQFTTGNDGGGDDFSVVNLTIRPLYLDVEISSSNSPLIDEHSSKFILDLSGPRVLFCADKSIDLLIKSGASQYVEFKSIDASFAIDENGKLWNVPDSRAAIFKDKSLDLREKKWLMRLFKLVQGQLAIGNENQDDEEEAEKSSKISEEDLESPFVDFLKKRNFSSKIKSMILYAIAMEDYDQDNPGSCENLLKTKDGIDRLAMYQSSVGRFTNAPGAFIYPIYGQGEMPPAFCRRAAVKGSIYVLRMPVIALLMDKSSGVYKGVRLASGQDIFSQKLVMDPSLTVSSTSAFPLDTLNENFQSLCFKDVKGKIARGICILRSSLKPDIANFLVVYPPRSLFPEQITSIRAVQIGGNFAVCPPSMFILYLSASCDDAHQGKKLLNAAITALLTTTNSAKPESSSTEENENADTQPVLLWSALYIQELTTGQFDSISSTSMPDGKLDYSDVVDSAIKLYQKMYPNEEFFPETVSETENSEDDVGLSLET